MHEFILDTFEHDSRALAIWQHQNARPSDFTRLLLDATTLILAARKSQGLQCDVLVDVGVREGLVPIWFSRDVRLLYGTEISAPCIEAFRTNKLLHGCKNIDIFPTSPGTWLCDLPNGDIADVVTFNPPSVPEDGSTSVHNAHDILQLTLEGGDNGRRTLEVAIPQIVPRLGARSQLVIVVPEYISGAWLSGYLGSYGLESKEILRKTFTSEAGGPDFDRRRHIESIYGSVFIEALDGQSVAYPAVAISACKR